MTKIIVKELVWDEWNKEHIKKHKVSIDEVEYVIKNILIHQRADKGRYLIIGRCGLRILSLIVNRKGAGIYYLVTARDSAKRERRKLYEKENK